MDKAIAFICAVCLAISETVSGASQAPDESPDFFTVTAKQVTEALKNQIMNSFGEERNNSHGKRAEEEGNDENLLQPELHFSTLRAEASGSGIPSPIMFVGGFSFMMMPAPEGDKIFNTIMEGLPNLGSKTQGRK